MKGLVADKISDEGLAALRDAGDLRIVLNTGLGEDELCQAVSDVEGLIIRSGAQVTRRVIEAAKVLKVIGRAGVGVGSAWPPE